MDYELEKNDTNYLPACEIVKNSGTADAALTSCAELLESEARKLTDTADACCDITTRLEIMIEVATMLRAAIMVRERMAGLNF